MRMEIHELKTWPKYFKQVRAGIKTFELRKFDRDYKVGDILKLKEYRFTDPGNLSVGEYSGDEIKVEVTSIITSEEGSVFGLADGYCIMSIQTPL